MHLLSNKKTTSFINKLIQDFEIEVDKISSSNLKGVAVLQLKISSLNEIQTIRSQIMDSARRLYITIKEITIK